VSASEAGEDSAAAEEAGVTDLETDLTSFGRTNIIIVCALIAGSILYGVWNLRDGGDGVTFDEPYYILGGAYYVGARPIDPGLCSEPWEFNHEHPPMAKLAMGMGVLFWTMLGTADDSLLCGARIAVTALFGLLLGAVWMLARPFGRSTAIVAVLFCIACPRLVGHARLATLDVPLACFWLWGMACALKATKEGWYQRHWAIGACVFSGAAMLTKFTGILVPGVIGTWLLATMLFDSSDAESDTPGRLPRNLMILPFAAFATGCVMLVVCWPWMWTDTVARLKEFVMVNATEHTRADVFYFGEVYTAGGPPPPRHYALVMLALTTPLLILIGAAAVMWRGERNLLFKREIWLLLIGGGALPLATIVTGGGTYDGVRSFLPAVPCICIIAAIGWQRLTERRAEASKDGDTQAACDARRQRIPLCIASGLILIAATCVRVPLSYYSFAAGGTAGAERLGMGTIYWASPATRQAFRTAQQNTGNRGRVKLIGFGGLVPPLLGGFKFFPKETVFVENDSWETLYVVHRMSFHPTVEFFENHPAAVPAHTITARVAPFAEVTVISVYTRPPKAAKPTHPPSPLNE
jgi:hypothetical protein